MMHISTYVASSNIHGLGLFANERIKKGTMIWSFQENFDRRYSEEEFVGLHPMIHQFFEIYGYRDKSDGFYYMTSDNDRYTNHSDFPNTFIDEATGYCYALKDIKKGEELTSDYREFIDGWERHFPAILSEVMNVRETA